MAVADVLSDRSSTPVDRMFQLGYWTAYRLMRAYWMVRHPVTRGTQVALWHGGEVLLVRNSYLPYYSAPGGYVRRHEQASEAAARELGEEVGIRITADRLQLELEVTHEWEYRRDHCSVFSLELPERPAIHVDHREVVEAGWFTPARAVGLDVFPPLKKVISARL